MRTPTTTEKRRISCENIEKKRFPITSADSHCFSVFVVVWSLVKSLVLASSGFFVSNFQFTISKVIHNYCELENKKIYWFCPTMCVLCRIRKKNACPKWWYFLLKLWTDSAVLAFYKNRMMWPRVEKIDHFQVNWTAWRLKIRGLTSNECRDEYEGGSAKNIGTF